MVLPSDTLVLNGRFRVLQPLGSGGMGQVYLGEQVSLGRKVAIKVLHQDLHLQPGMVERFKREAQLLSAVEHPAVVRIIDFGESEHSACLVMELVEGESLNDALQKGPLSPERALTTLRQLAEGLSAIHARGIIHRDIKPENVFLTKGARGEQARLLDFGIARLVEPDADSAVSQVGMVLGTPEYLSPEQAVGARADERSDLYCLGVLAYRVLSGQLPFAGPSPRQFIAQHASAAPLPLDRAAPGLATHPTLVPLVMRLLEKEPSRRLQSAHELADALAAAAALPLPASAVPPGMAAQLPGQPVSSGTAAFGASPAPDGEAPPPSNGPVIWRPGAPVPEAPAPGSSTTAAFGGPLPPVSSGTAIFGAAAPPSSGTLTSKPQNLTVMLTSIQGFSELILRQTRDEHVRTLQTYEDLLVPLLRERDGKLVQKWGDSLLAVFGSPTGAVLCGMEMQDRLWRHNQDVAPEHQLRVRICLHTGEVLLARGSVIGEPMEIAKSVEQVAMAGEVTFTESVNLARNRAGTESEPCGTIALPGVGGALQLYRSKRAAEGPPFGGVERTEASLAKKTGLGGKLTSGLLRPRTWGSMSGGSRGLAAGGVALGLLLLGSVAAVWNWNQSPNVQARRLLEANKPKEALQRIDAVPAEARKKDAALQLTRGRALHALGNHGEEYTTLLALEEAGKQDVGPSVLDGLAEDFSDDEGNKTLRKLLEALPKKPLHEHFESLAEGEYSPKQWGALRYLEAVQDTEGVDLVRAYTTALAAKHCTVRSKAARRLGALGNTDAVPALTKLASLPKEKGVFNSKNCGQDEANAALQLLKKKSN
ncbi:serine/threonine-protein kinase [Stigmatella aurantiaca]|uniref:Serine/threonine-protein kinase n=1 Tax=Stigmatella aurantiaca (strain DW4/3-1) TaxID=378806 RepID=E3FZ92_STIAD|nr:serine/threonine-protein kinase [Stigmatella aurantiaca]ADO74909.1 Serine/threonine-protein kinase [Stigmatella aurantiaca DW4/3-1]